MKEYKRKIWQEENSCDHSVKKFKKNFNSSERWRGKRNAEKEWKEFNNVDVNNLRWNMEIEQGDKCWEDECLGFANRLADTLYNLGLGKFNLHICTCEKLDDLSDEEILKRAGYL